MGKPDYIESRHEVDMSRRIADIRPWSDKMIEAMSDKSNFLFWSFSVALFGTFFPMLLPVTMLAFVVLCVGFYLNKDVLPYRYPVNVKDPSSGKTGEGIFYFGHVRSKNEFENFKQIWLSDDDLRKHMLILGSTGSGKSETLKAIFFNALSWSSGFFVADGKADSKLPNDVYATTRSFGRDCDLLILNFLLGGSTPEQIRKSRRRRTNKINPFSSADADTIIQMMSNMLPKVEGEGKNWQEKALNLLRSLVIALCYKRDTAGFELSVSTFIDYLALPKIEELYVEGYQEWQRTGSWSYGYNGIKAYLESGGCPGFKLDKLKAKFNLDNDQSQAAAPSFAAARQQPGKTNEQDNQVYEQHSYRSTQLLPVMNLLDKTYGFIFRDKYPEIDMIDVTLNNRILVMLIPSLEKSAQEAENLGKLAIACLRVMMGKNLGSEVEGTKEAIQDSKATNAPYPYIVALDELGYYFADGIAVMFAQARSLGFCMVAAAQDLKKLTEGTREAEAGAMVANTTNKIFMRIDENDKTLKLVQESLGKVNVGAYQEFEYNGVGWSREREVRIQEVDRVSTSNMQKMQAGWGIVNAAGVIRHAMSFYVGDDIKKYGVKEFFVNRFLQVPTPAEERVLQRSIPLDGMNSKQAKGNVMMSLLKGRREPAYTLPPDGMMEAVGQVAAAIRGNEHIVPAYERAIAYFDAAMRVIQAERNAAAGNKVQTAGTFDLPKSENEERTGASIKQRGATGPVREDMTLDGLRAAAGADLADEVRIDPSRAASGATGMAAGTVDDSSDALSFLDANFVRKPADQILREVEAAAPIGQEPLPDSGSIYQPAEPQVTSHFAKLFQDRKDRNVGDFGGRGAKATSRGKIFDVLHELQYGQQPQTQSSWIDTAISMSNDPGDVSTDDTAVGFSEPVLNSMVNVERALGSPSPELSARRLEGVVSSQVTPNTKPSADANSEEISAVFSSFEDYR